MDVTSSFLLWMKIFVILIATSKQTVAERSGQQQVNFRKIRDQNWDTLPPEDVISSHAVDFEDECGFKCLEKSTCVGVNFRPKSNKYAVNCQLSKKPQEGGKIGGRGEWTFYQDLETLTTKNQENEGEMNDILYPHIPDNITNCRELHKMMPHLPNGYYKFKTLEAYCDLSNNGWTLIARFANGDSKHWTKNGSFWYDKIVPYGNVSSTNNDMISTAFWRVKGDEIKITKSDDSNHTALLQTVSNCLQGGTFRSKITSYGNFRNAAVWASDGCRGNCQVSYGGQYKTTAGFDKHSCGTAVQSGNYIGFWCDYGGQNGIDGAGAVMMIGGAGRICRADHGIGITDENHAKFGFTYGYDFGYPAYNGEQYTPSAYSLNLWVR